MKNLARSIINKTGFDLVRLHNSDDGLIKQYTLGGKIPWSTGYVQYKSRYIDTILRDDRYISLFEKRRPLPQKYGQGLDERCIEYPWLFSRLTENDLNIMDAGSALNHDYILNHAIWNDKRVTIVTLSPENNCFWHRSISYQYEDLRSLPFRDKWFDAIICISTLEHIGMNNQIYTKDNQYHEADTESFKDALYEFNRVLRPGGKLLLTVPFGKYQNCKMFQQFDKAMLKKASAVFNPEREEISIYAYSQDGWQISDMDASNKLEFSNYAISLWDGTGRQVEPERDNAAAARAVACVCWEKRN